MKGIRSQEGQRGDFDEKGFDSRWSTIGEFTEEGYEEGRPGLITRPVSPFMGPEVRYILRFYSEIIVFSFF